MAVNKMTIEETLPILTNKYAVCCDFDTGDYIEWDREFFEAVGVAIEALQKLEKIEKMLDDWTKPEALEWELRRILDGDSR